MYRSSIKMRTITSILKLIKDTIDKLCLVHFFNDRLNAKYIHICQTCRHDLVIRFVYNARNIKLEYK